MQMDNEIHFNKWLRPLSFLYGAVIKWRNRLFDRGFLPSEKYPIPVICVGNLAVGGTGKTPHTEYIIRLLKNRYRVAVLSRGYKRKTSGFILATAQSTSREIGDEPCQMKTKFPDILVAVDADRRRGIRNLLALPAADRPQVIILDDAFQYRYVNPLQSIVLTDCHRLAYEDRLLPEGRLREPFNTIERADVIIVTKCSKHMTEAEYGAIEERLHARSHQSVFFSHIVYGGIEPVCPEAARPLSREMIGRDEDILLISGIASPKLFIEEAKKYSKNIHAVVFPDHHAFDKSDLRKLDAIYTGMSSPGKFILATEKDAVRLKGNPLVPESWKSVLYYLPITIDINDRDGSGKERFDAIVERAVENRK